MFFESQALMSLQDIQPPHNRPLVICRTSAIQLSSSLWIDRQLERRVLPSIFHECRLDIIVPVNKEVLLQRLGDQSNLWRGTKEAAKNNPCGVGTYLLGIVTDGADHHGRENELLAFNDVRADLTLLGLDTQGCELGHEKVCHGDYIFGVARTSCQLRLTDWAGGSSSPFISRHADRIST
jgi:hypothetical protein